MSYEQQSLEAQRINRLEHILREPWRVEAEIRLARVAGATARHRHDAMLSGQQRREFIVRVRGGAEAGEQQDWRARAAEIQHLQLHAFIHADRGSLMWRGIAPSHFLKAKIGRAS